MVTSSPRQRSRVFLIGCAWFFAGSTLTTVLLCAKDVTKNDATFHTNNEVPFKRKPHRREFDYGDGSDDISGGAPVSGDYPASLQQQQQQQQQQQEDGDDVRLTSLNVKNIVNNLQTSTSTESTRSVVENTIFWSQQAESFVPVGLTEREWHDFMTSVSRTPVMRVEAAKWNRCGRPKNKYVTLRDGTTVCVRYRHPVDTLLRGELLTFQLSRLLGIDSVPATMLSITDSESLPWQGFNLSHAGWQSNQIVTMTKWVHHLGHTRSRVHLPPLLLSAYRSGEPLSTVHSVTQDELSSLVQWTDLILLDYITGHYDRMASMQDGATHESNPNIMQQSVRNLRRQWPSGKLWLIDNESGLLDAYMLLYGPNAGAAGSQFQEFHRRMLQSSCIFRRQTVRRLQWLSQQFSPSQVLESVTAEINPLYKQFAETNELTLFRLFFNVRLKEVLQWIHTCTNDSSHY